MPQVIDLLDQARTLRSEGQRARRLAKGLSQQEDQVRYLRYAEDLESLAAELARQAARQATAKAGSVSQLQGQQQVQPEQSSEDSE